MSKLNVQDFPTDPTAAVEPFVGDAGVGGVKGAVPAPPVGSAAAGDFLRADGTWAAPPGGSGGGGTVTSVGLTMPAEFAVSGSPVNSSGTLAVTKATEAANTVWAGPASGPAAAPVFRGLVAADMPSSGVGSGTVTSVGLTMPAEFSVSGSPVNSSGTFAVTKATEVANTVWAGPASGSAAAPAFRALLAADLPLVVLRVLMITAAGTYTPSSGTRALYVEAVGGGGGGGSANITSSNASASAGGAAGAYAASFISSPAASYSVTLGAGGSGGTAGGAGGSGGDTLFGSVITAKGGGGGAAGTAAGTAAAYSSGGSQQSGSVGDVVIPGSIGGNGVVISGTLAAAGAGGGNTLSPVGNAGPVFYTSGAVSGRGAGAYGGGGPGAANVGTQATAEVGAGGNAGACRVWEFA